MLVSILQNNMDNYCEVIKNDNVLKLTDMKFYQIIKDMDEEVRLQLEELYSEYASRAMQISYVYGMKDFFDMFIILNKDTEKIINELDEIL